MAHGSSEEDVMARCGFESGEVAVTRGTNLENLALDADASPGPKPQTSPLVKIPRPEPSPLSSTLTNVSPLSTLFRMSISDSEDDDDVGAQRTPSSRTSRGSGRMPGRPPRDLPASQAEAPAAQADTKDETQDQAPSTDASGGGTGVADGAHRKSSNQVVGGMSARGRPSIRSQRVRKPNAAEALVAQQLGEPAPGARAPAVVASGEATSNTGAPDSKSDSSSDSGSDSEDESASGSDLNIKASSKGDLAGHAAAFLAGTPPKPTPADDSHKDATGNNATGLATADAMVTNGSGNGAPGAPAPVSAPASAPSETKQQQPESPAPAPKVRRTGIARHIDEQLGKVEAARRGRSEHSRGDVTERGRSRSHSRDRSNRDGQRRDHDHHHSRGHDRDEGRDRGRHRDDDQVQTNRSHRHERRSERRARSSLETDTETKGGDIGELPGDADAEGDARALRVKSLYERLRGLGIKYHELIETMTSSHMYRLPWSVVRWVYWHSRRAAVRAGF